jgi:hypothetical protein
MSKEKIKTVIDYDEMDNSTPSDVKVIVIRYDTKNGLIDIKRSGGLTVMEEIGLSTYYYNLINNAQVMEILTKQISDEVIHKLDVRTIELMEAMSTSVENQKPLNEFPLKNEGTVRGN